MPNMWLSEKVKLKQYLDGKIDRIKNGVDFPFKTKWNTKEYFCILKKQEEILKDKKKILDIGCGRGESTHYLSCKKHNVTGLEVKKFETWIQLKGKFRTYNGKLLPFKENEFDAVILNCVLEHIKEKEEFYLEIKRVAKENATILFVLPTIQWRLQEIKRIPLHIIAEVRGYRHRFGYNYWGVHEPKVYGHNWIRETKDYLHWEQILREHFKTKVHKIENNRFILVECGLK